MRKRRSTFAEQVDEVKFLRSREANFESIGYGWRPNWELGRYLQGLHGWHVDPWMGREVRRHFAK